MAVSVKQFSAQGSDPAATSSSQEIIAANSGFRLLMRTGIEIVQACNDATAGLLLSRSKISCQQFELIF